MTNIQSKLTKLLIAFAFPFLMGVHAFSFNQLFNYKSNQEYVQPDEYIDDEDFSPKNRWDSCNRAGQFMVGQGWRLASWGFFASKKCAGFTKNILKGSANTLWSAAYPSSYPIVYPNTYPIVYPKKVEPTSYSAKIGELGTKAFFLTGYALLSLGKKTAELSEISMDWASNASYRRYQKYLTQLESHKIDNNAVGNTIVIV